MEEDVLFFWESRRTILYYFMGSFLEYTFEKLFLAVIYFEFDFR